MDAPLYELGLKDYLPLWEGDMDAAKWADKRRELKRLLEERCYGAMPEKQGNTRNVILSENANAWGGAVTEIRAEAHFPAGDGEFTLPYALLMPNGVEKPPVILYLSFDRALPNRYTPVEEICARGYALCSVCYLDIAPDTHDGDFSAGLCARLIGRGIERRAGDCGRIGVWAFAASRLLDALLTYDTIDAEHTAVAGHSRLGKTALWAAACDERFFCAISNCSGFGGAANARHGEGERVIDFIRAGSWDWFCERFKDDCGREDDRVFDQHFLLALIAPRLLCVGSADMDVHADPKAEFLTSLAASRAWEIYGKAGLVCESDMPKAGDSFDAGSIHYHLRSGTHFLSRRDWNAYLDFLDLRLGRAGSAAHR